MLLSLFLLLGGVFFRWTIQAQPHFWPWHACLNQALHERSSPQSERADAYSLTRRNYQEILEPLILGINCQAENQVQKCLWRARFSMTGPFLFQGKSNSKDLAVCFHYFMHFSDVMIEHSNTECSNSCCLLQELMGGPGWMQAVRRCADMWCRVGKWKMRFPCFSGVWLVMRSQWQTSKHYCVLCVSWYTLHCQKQRGRELR